MAEVEDDDEIFVYTGGDQVVPRGVRRGEQNVPRRVVIDRSVKIIPEMAFQGRKNLVSVDVHNGIERIGMGALANCISLRLIKLLGVTVIEEGAFSECSGLTDLEFGDKLETIEHFAFTSCTSLRSITMPSARSIGRWAFSNCIRLTDLDLPKGLDAVGRYAFRGCTSLRRIAMPLKYYVIEDDAFHNCPKLSTVDLVGGIHKTIASLHLERWRNDMIVKIDRINQLLSDTHAEEKTAAIRQWIESVIGRIEHYKTEHKALLKEATTLLELALWKANLDERKRESVNKVKAGRGKVDIQSERNESRIKSGASIVIKNVLPFLTLV